MQNHDEEEDGQGRKALRVATTPFSKLEVQSKGLLNCIFTYTKMSNDANETFRHYLPAPKTVAEAPLMFSSSWASGVSPSLFNSSETKDRSTFPSFYKILKISSNFLSQKAPAEGLTIVESYERQKRIAVL